MNPADAIFVPKDFRDADGSFMPILATDLDGNGCLSASCDAHDPGKKVSILLCVKVMDFACFGDVLQNFISSKTSLFSRLLGGIPWSYKFYTASQVSPNWNQWPSFPYGMSFHPKS